MKRYSKDTPEEMSGSNNRTSSHGSYTPILHGLCVQPFNITDHSKASHSSTGHGTYHDGSSPMLILELMLHVHSTFTPTDVLLGRIRPASGRDSRSDIHHGHSHHDPVGRQQNILRQNTDGNSIITIIIFPNIQG